MMFQKSKNDILSNEYVTDTLVSKKAHGRCSLSMQCNQDLRPKGVLIEHLVIWGITGMLNININLVTEVKAIKKLWDHPRVVFL